MSYVLHRLTITRLKEFLDYRLCCKTITTHQTVQGLLFGAKQQKRLLDYVNNWLYLSVVRGILQYYGQCSQMNFILLTEMGQSVTIFDLLVDEKGKQYAVGNTAAAKSSFSTTIKAGDIQETEDESVCITHVSTIS